MSSPGPIPLDLAKMPEGYSASTIVLQPLEAVQANLAIYRDINEKLHGVTILLMTESVAWLQVKNSVENAIRHEQWKEYVLKKQVAAASSDPFEK